MKKQILTTALSLLLLILISCKKEEMFDVASNPEPPVAGFNPSATSGTAPVAINFINTSTGQITSYAWTFGDGSNSNVAAPSHTFTSAGTYTVKLVVSGPGGTNTASTTITVTSAPPTKCYIAQMSIQCTYNYPTKTYVAIGWNFGSYELWDLQFCSRYINITDYAFHNYTAGLSYSTSQYANYATPQFKTSDVVIFNAWDYKGSDMDYDVNSPEYDDVKQFGKRVFLFNELKNKNFPASYELKDSNFPYITIRLQMGYIY